MHSLTCDVRKRTCLFPYRRRLQRLLVLSKSCCFLPGWGENSPNEKPILVVPTVKLRSVPLPSRIELKRLIRAVEKLDGGKPQVTVADILEIVNLVFTSTIDEMAGVARRIGRLYNGTILRMRPRPTRCDGSPEIIQHVSMKSDPLTRSEPNLPNAHSIRFGQEPRADLAVILIRLELLANGGGPNRHYLLICISSHCCSP